MLTYTKKTSMNKLERTRERLTEEISFSTQYKKNQNNLLVELSEYWIGLIWV